MANGNKDPDNVDAPPSAQAVLRARPGTINDISNDDVDFTTVSEDETGWSLIQRAVKKTLSPS